MNDKNTIANWPLKISALCTSLFLLPLASRANQGRLLLNDLDALQARVTLIEHAKQEIQFEYFEVGQDATAVTGMGLLLEAAQRGVKVKVLADFRANALKQAQMAALTEVLDGTQWAGNLDIRIFNDPEGASPLHQTYRNHEKLLAIDGNSENPMMVVGGRNIAETYFGQSRKFNFLDSDALILGPSVKVASTYFSNLWNSNPEISKVDLGDYSKNFLNASCSMEISNCEGRKQKAKKEIAQAAYQISEHLNKFKRGELATKSEPIENQLKGLTEIGPVEMLFNDPSKMMTKMTNKVVDQVLALFKDKNTKDVVIVTPYLFPTESEMAAFSELTARGAKVRIITNSLASTDSTLVHAAFLRIKQQLINSGIEVFMFKPHDEAVNPAGKSPPQTLHTKLIIINGLYSIHGSFNFDIRSANLNREILFVVGKSDTIPSDFTKETLKFIEEKILSRSIKIFGDKRDNPGALEELDKLATPAQKENLEYDAKSVDAYWNHI
jgi:putative cardiolipin synthase